MVARHDVEVHVVQGEVVEHVGVAAEVLLEHVQHAVDVEEEVGEERLQEGQ